ncbi:ABC transporter transmembrane domain-containing protein [Anaerosporobacter sp.]
MSNLLQLCKRKTCVIVTLIVSIVSIIITLFWNYKLSQLINQVQFGISITSTQILVVFVLMIISTLSQGSFTYLSGYTSEYITHDLRMYLAHRLLKKSYYEVEQLSTGEQLSQLQNEVSEISSYLTGSLFMLINDGIRFIFTFIWLLTMNSKLTILANLPVIIILIYVIYTSKAIEGLSKQSQSKQQQMNGFADILLTLFPIIRIYEANELLQNRYNDKVEEWKRTTSREEMTRARLMSLSAVLSCIPLLLILLVGGTLVIRGEISIGLVYIFVNLSGNVSGVMMNMPGHIANLRRSIGNLERILYEEEGE